MKSNVVIVIIAIVVAAGVGYYAYGAGHSAGVAEAAAVRTGFFNDPTRFPGGGQPGAAGQQNPGGQRGQGGAGAAAFFGGLQGTVDKVDGNTLTVSVTRGGQTQSVQVTIASDTTVQTFTTGNLSDIKAGSRILVGTDRTAGNGGTPQPASAQVTARTITLLPASFGP